MAAAVILALVPVVLLTALGHALRTKKFLAEAFWPEAERLAYFILVPCLFFHGLATADIGQLPLRAMAFTIFASTIPIAAVVVLLRPLFGLDGPAFTSLFQGSIRFSNYVGLTLASGLLGASGIALAAVCNATIVPTVNVLCVLVFAWTGATKLSPLGVAKQLATNPLVTSSLAGLAFKLAGFSLPPWLEPVLRSLGAASLPLGLLCVGAALNFDNARTWLKPIVISSGFKFIALPTATAIAATRFGLTGPALTIALLFQCLPTATTSYILAKQLNGDAKLMAGIVAAQTVIAFISIPMAMAVMGWALGL